MKEALTQASARNLTGFTMALDSLQLIDLLKVDKFYLEIYGTMQDIIKIANALEISFVFVPRSDNEDADTMAKSALNVVPNNPV